MKRIEKTILVTEALLDSGMSRENIREKVDYFLTVQRPEIFLDDSSKEIYDRLVEEKKKKGLIV